MSDPTDERPADDGHHEDWLTHLAGPDRPARSESQRGGSLRDRGQGLRDRGGLRQLPAPALDAARLRTPRSIVAPRPATPAPVEVEVDDEVEVEDEPQSAAPQPTAPVKVVPAARHGVPAAQSGVAGRLARPVRSVKLPALPKIKLSASDFQRLVSHVRTLKRPELHRPTWRLSRHQAVALATGMVALVGSVAGLALLVPSKPVLSPGTGAVNSVDFKSAANPPTSTFNFGPYFATGGGKVLMMGSDGTSSFVWGSSDGSNWERYTSADSFGPTDRRFVALGFAADGNGGYVAVGDSFTSDSKVSASAWYSRDGKKWFAASVDFPENAEMMGLAVGSDAMVAAGNGVAWISRGGSNWTMVPLPGATGYVARAVRTWAGGFAIVSAWGGEGDRKSAVWVSPDGERWLQAWQALALFDVEDAVAYGGGLVAVGSQARSVAEMATPTPKPTPTLKTTAKPKVTAKPTKTPAKTVAPSGSPGTSIGPSLSPSPTTVAIAYQSAGSWSSANGLQWFRGSGMGGPYAQSMTSVTQAFDSLVAVSSEPGNLPGLAAAPSGALTLWITDDGTGWKPIQTNVPALSRGRVVQYGSFLVLAGVAPGGSLSVLSGEMALGAPLPPLSSTPTPAIAFSLKAGESPMIPGGKSGDVLGPVVGTRDRFYAFITQAGGTGVWTSTDGRAWTQQAKPADLLAKGAKGTPFVLDAVEDGQGGIMAVGKITATEGDAAMIWRLSGGTWKQATITGSAPTALGSVAVHDGKFVAAASVAEGPRVMVSENGSAWVGASLAGASSYFITVTSYSAGFVASGTTTGATEADPTDALGPEATASPGALGVWTSADGLAWTAQTQWALPRNPGPVMGAGDGLVMTSTGITGKDSWWWSADGKAWQEAHLTTVPGGCMASLDAGLVKVAPPAVGSEDPTWRVWVSEDGKAWQNSRIDNVTFGATTICRVTSVGKKIVIVGWQSAGVLQVYFSK